MRISKRMMPPCSAAAWTNHRKPISQSKRLSPRNMILWMCSVNSHRALFAWQMNLGIFRQKKSLKVSKTFRLFLLHLLQNLNRVLDPLQTFFFANDLHTFKKRRADCLPGGGHTENTKNLIGIQSAFFDICPQRLLASF